MSKKVAVILVNYKDYANRFLLECRDGLRMQDYSKELFEVYIVDNESSNESRRFIADNYPEAKIIERGDGNYSAGNNAGIKRGTEDGCEYFVMVNMDVKLKTDWLTELVRAAETRPDAGIIQSKIYLYPKTEEEWKNPKINTIGNEIHYLGFGFTRGYGETSNPPDPLCQGGDDCSEIRGYASGCSLLIKKEVLEKVGGYDEEFYMYHDDVELSWKAKLAGYKIYLAPKSILYHKYDFDRSVRMLYYMERNRYIAMFAFYKLETLIFLSPVILAMDIAMLVYSIFKGWLETKLDVYAYFLKSENWDKTIKLREDVKKFRTVSDKTIAEQLSGKILFQEISNPLLDKVGNPFLDLYWKIIKPLIKW